MPIDDIKKINKGRENKSIVKNIVKKFGKYGGKYLGIGLLAAGTIFAGSEALSNIQAKEVVSQQQNIEQSIQDEKSKLYNAEAYDEITRNIDVGEYSKFDLIDDYIAGRTFDSTKIKEYFGENVTEEDLRNWQNGIKSENIEYDGGYEDVKLVVEAYLLGVDKTYEKNGVENKYASQDDFTKKNAVYEDEAREEIKENIDVDEYSVFDHENYYVAGRTLDFSRLKEVFGSDVNADDLRNLSEGKDSVHAEFDEKYEDSKSMIKAFLLGYDKTVEEQELENENIETRNSIMQHYHNQEKENMTTYVEDENTLVVSGGTGSNTQALEDDGRSM